MFFFNLDVTVHKGIHSFPRLEILSFDPPSVNHSDVNIRYTSMLGGIDLYITPLPIIIFIFWNIILHMITTTKTISVSAVVIIIIIISSLSSSLSLTYYYHRYHLLLDVSLRTFFSFSHRQSKTTPPFLATRHAYISTAYRCKMHNI